MQILPETAGIARAETSLESVAFIRTEPVVAYLVGGGPKLVCEFERGAVGCFLVVSLCHDVRDGGIVGQRAGEAMKKGLRVES